MLVASFIFTPVPEIMASGKVTPRVVRSRARAAVVVGSAGGGADQLEAGAERVAVRPQERGDLAVAGQAQDHPRTLIVTENVRRSPGHGAAIAA